MSTVIPVEASKLPRSVDSAVFSSYNVNEIRTALTDKAVPMGASGFIVVFCDDGAGYLVLSWAKSDRKGSHFNPWKGKKGIMVKNRGGFVSIQLMTREACGERFSPRTKGFKADLASRRRELAGAHKANAAAIKGNSDRDGYLKGIPSGMVRESDGEA